MSPMSGEIGQTGPQASSGCPVDHENMSKEEIAAFMAQHKHGAAVGATSAAKAVPTPRSDVSAAAESDEGRGGCPVDHKNMSKEEIAAYMAKHKHPMVDKSAAANATQGKPKTVYDVYGQEIDPANMMPSTPNQLPSPGQAERLSTDRVSSSIPKSEADGSTWTYPSPQMFYNALKRKGKADDVSEADMESVVAIHNNMNEQTWNEVLEWERRFHCDECENPKLRKFQGRPHDLSPAARFRTIFRGYPAPFDRHDWVLDRCGQADVRYIIDYYYREHPVGQNGPIELHVRPALDSPGAIWDRARFRFAAFRDALMPSADRDMGAPAEARAESLPGPGALQVIPAADGSISDDEFTFLKELTPEKINAISDDVRRDCAKIGLALAENRADPDAFERANVALNYCMATKICQPQAKQFIEAMESGSGKETPAYADMTSCLDRFHVMARRVMTIASGVPQTGPEKQ